MPRRPQRRQALRPNTHRLPVRLRRSTAPRPVRLQVRPNTDRLPARASTDHRLAPRMDRLLELASMGRLPDLANTPDLASTGHPLEQASTDLPRAPPTGRRRV